MDERDKLQERVDLAVEEAREQREKEGREPPKPPKRDGIGHAPEREGTREYGSEDPQLRER